MDSSEHKFCIIIGAGMCGITVAAELISRNILRFDEFEILDKQPDYGGVWCANTYPGAACDVVSHCYSMSFHLNPKWSRLYAPRDEIQHYYGKMAKHYNLDKSTRFNISVTSATWNQDTLLWTVVAEDVFTRRIKTYTANVVVSAVGQFTRPKYANIPGSGDFKGTVWHTANWNHEYDLTGKRVAIIGTGPSTAQLIPYIQPIVKKLTLYQRSPTYVLPRGDAPIPKTWIVIFTWFPFILWMYHTYLCLQKEFTKNKWYSGTDDQALSQVRAIEHLEAQVADPVLRTKLLPRHEFGCKRPLVLDDYYPTLCQPNVELITDKPLRITENSIISQPPAGAYDVQNAAPEAAPLETPIDVLIWGTGFEMHNMGANFAAYGIGGVKLEELWGEEPAAYYGVVTHQFPNFLIMFGPNTGAPWANLCTMFEVQAKYNAQMIKHLKVQNSNLVGERYALVVQEAAQLKFNDWIQANMGPLSIVSPNCSNYYINSKGHITFNWPFHGYYYWWCLRKPNFKDYVSFRQPIKRM
ncbi:FAD/NAD(P)-binding domain-containing protein [Zopfia rhizophila CBS 207.26]|uniref:FAD/NAD(P)-binding domain-containing protein n=1 Tax=Zopfia rhizophila CBS 207.26 TaxID=1314779 RepID=A0A6A6DPY0_9PEZI|nr:FAD/NAD(P)-binding domain-containing protein [Zopfia rhizophila CBS 207.26]